MELEKKINTKFSNLNPTCIKDNNMNCVNIFDTSLGGKKIFDDGFKVDTIIKNISLKNPDMEFIPNETLIFFDEILEAILGTTEILIGLATIPHHLH